MTDLAFHISDIAENSVAAGARRVDIALTINGSTLSLCICDDGRGMSAEVLRRALTTPFTTRGGGHGGHGLPLLVSSAEQAGGEVSVNSTPGEGTTVTARFPLASCGGPTGDKPSADFRTGDVAEALMLFMTGNPSVVTTVRFARGADVFEVCSLDIEDAAQGVPISHPRVATLVGELLGANLRDILPELATNR